jgi:hypothetical protein
MLNIIEVFKREAQALGVDDNSVKEFSYWIAANSHKHAWIEPLKSDQASDETWITKNHPELFDGKHPMYAYSDDEMKENGIIIIGSTPITKNFVKNFKLNFEDKYEPEDKTGE